MITVKVTYGVKKAYVETNKEMILKFLADFRALDGSKFIYSVFQQDDQETFVHFSQFQDEEIQQLVLQVPSFVAFQKSRDNNLSSAHNVVMLNPIGTTKPTL